MHEKYLPVKQLAIYLPKKQLINFKENTIIEELEKKMNEIQSTLIEFFIYNQANNES